MTYNAIFAKHSGKCLDVDISKIGMDNGARVQQWDYWGGDNQLWELEPVGDNYFKITAKHSGKCLDVSGIGMDNGAYIHQWDYWGGDNQKWKLEPVGDDCFKITAKHSGKCLDVSGIGMDNGAYMHQWDYWGGDNQKWKVVPINQTASSPLRAEQGPDHLATGEWMESKVIFSESGRVDTETSIWTTMKMYGFTGGCTTFFLDKNGNVLANTPMRPYGVDGVWIPGLPSSRTILEVDDVGQDVFNKTTELRIVHKLTPKSRLMEDINQGVAIGKSIAEVIAIIAAL